MKSSTLQVVCWILLVICNTVQTQPQTKPAKKETSSSISGKVTIKGKGAPGIVVGLRSPDPYGRPTSTDKGTTDQDGNYRITNLPPGTYRVMPLAPAFVSSDELRGKTLIITEGEVVEGIDFALARGGVITGKAVDAEGQPLIEEQIILSPAEANPQGIRNQGPIRSNQTDDRGVYRIFGIRPGKYYVALKQSDGEFGGGRPRRSQYNQTYSPGVTDAAKASVIEVTEGSEATNVDITIGRSLATFSISGRIVNRDTQQAVQNSRLGLQKTIGDTYSSVISWVSASNSEGEFKIENMTPGRYVLFVPSKPNSGIRADPVPFEVVDQDVSDLLVQTSEGASLSGTVGLEGRNDKPALALLRQAQVQPYANSSPNSDPPVPINSDGSFRVSGLSSGLVNFELVAANHRPIIGLTVIRVERDGLAQPNGVELKDGEHVSGVRLVVVYGNGTIRGVVKIENGELPPNARFGVWLSNALPDPPRAPNSFPSPEVDSRGRFIVDGLAAGTYQLHASIYIPDSRTRPPMAVRQVNVVEGAVTEVTITLNLEPIPNSGNP